MSIRMRHTSSHTKNRRSHHALDGVKAIKNADGKLILPHRVDESTGMYRGRQIFVAKTKGKKAAKVKGPHAEVAHDHKHEGAEHKHDNAEKKQARGFFGRVGNARPKARSGAGGGGSGKSGGK